MKQHGFTGFLAVRVLVYELEEFCVFCIVCSLRDPSKDAKFLSGNNSLFSVCVPGAIDRVKFLLPAAPDCTFLVLYLRTL